MSVRFRRRKRTSSLLPALRRDISERSASDATSIAKAWANGVSFIESRQKYAQGWVSLRQTMSYFFQGASGNDKPDSKTMRSLDSTPLGNPLTTYANIA